MASGIVWSSSTLALRCGSLSAAPALDAGPPVLGHLGEDVDPGADVLAALGVVGREGRQGVGPSGLPVAVVGVHRLGADAEPAGLAADLVERHQAVVDVEGGVLDPLGRHRRRHLLELAGEPPLLGPVLLARGVRRFQEQHVADEVEHPAAQQRVAGHGPPHGGLDVAAVRVVDGPRRRCRSGRPGSRRSRSRSACRSVLKVKSRERRLFCASRSSWLVSMCSSLESDTCMIRSFLR